MKKLLPTLLMLLLVNSVGWLHAADPQTIPAEALALNEKLAAGLRPAVHTWIVLEGNSISRNPDASENTIRADIQSRFTGQSLNAPDVNTLTFMVLIDAVQHMETLSKTERESPGDIPDAQTQRLQVAMQRRPQFIETISFLMKKVPGEPNTALQSLK